MGAVSPGDSNQKIMGSFRFGIALLVLISVATAKDVFRYDDVETGQSHYMTGDPGKSVEGGWEFTNPDGTFNLVYTADEGGFQPKADHIPDPVEDTKEVDDAKAKFYTLFEEQKAKVKAAKAVVDARRKRSPKDVFRYEEADQSHYMTGEPGKAVEGGWTFTNPEGTYELVYKADEMGFQPKAAHIPVPVENTNEVVDATAKFYSLYNEHKAKVEAAIAEDAATVVDARRKKREAHGVDPKFKFHPYYGYVPKDAKEEVEEPKEFKFLPYHGFVPADETVEGEEKFLETLHPYHKKMTEKRFKLDPYHGFVPFLENEPEVKYHPYYGFVPVEEEPKEVKEFKFLPYHGFVPADEVIEGEEALLKNLHPYHQKMASKKFKLDPYYGFIPIMEDDAPAAVSERKKRDTETVEKSQDLTLPPHPYNFHPFLGLGAVKPEDSENKLYKYIPYYGFVPAEKEEENEEAIEGEEGQKTVLYKYDPLYGFVKADQEIKPLEEQEYKYTPYVGFVPVTGEEEEDVKTYKFNPFYGFVEKTDEDNEETAEEMSEQQYKFVPFYGFVPVNEDGVVEETAKNYGNLKYTFHPYYGFLPTPTDGEVEEQLYKLDPVVGFYPSEKEETQEAELDAKRKKREAQFLLNPVVPVPVYPVQQQVVLVPTGTEGEDTQTGKTGNTDTEGGDQTQTTQQILTTYPVLATPVFGSQFLFRYPQFTYPVATLPEEYPVIPHDPEDKNEGSVEF